MRAADMRAPEGGGAVDRTRNSRRRARTLAQKYADAMPVVAMSGPRQVRVVDAPLQSPAPRGGMREVVRERYVLRLVVVRQLAAMYGGSLLGLLWSYVQPALRFGVYYAVMGFILKLQQDQPFFAVRLFTGIVFVHYFSETWNGGTRSIWQNRALMKKMRMPRELFPVAAMVVAGYHTAPQILVLVLLAVLAGWHLTWAAVAAGLLGLAILIVFSGALAISFSALNVFYRDFQNIVQTILQFMHFMVPMMYPFSRVYAVHGSQPWLYELYMANPVAQAVILMQQFFWYPLIDDPTDLGGATAYPPDMWIRGLITLAVCLGLLGLAQGFFTRVEGKFPERL